LDFGKILGRKAAGFTIKYLKTTEFWIKIQEFSFPETAEYHRESRSIPREMELVNYRVKKTNYQIIEIVGARGISLC